MTAASDKKSMPLWEFMRGYLFLLCRFNIRFNIRLSMPSFMYQGKTLAFVLPILESLINGPAKSLRKTGYGRPPSVLVLLPTRELASQVLRSNCQFSLSLHLLP